MPWAIRENPWQRVLVSAPARAATSTIASATTRPSAAPAASAIPPAAARTPAASATVSAMRTIAMWPVARDMRRSVAVEVRLAFSFVRKIAAAFNHHRARRRRNWSELALCPSRHRQTFRPPAAHLGALLFQNRLTRQPDAVALHRQPLPQNLIAF